MNFEVISVEQIPDVKVIKYKLFTDARGMFGETFRNSEFEELGFPKFVQENVSVSAGGVLRGLHYQLNPKAQAKLVHCLEGSIFDVVVDIRKTSPTYGQHLKFYLERGTLLFVPAGFAHGFLAQRDNTVVSYKISEYYSKEHERSICYNDPKLNIMWPSHHYMLTQKDREAPSITTAENNF